MERWGQELCCLASKLPSDIVEENQTILGRSKGTHLDRHNAELGENRRAVYYNINARADAGTDRMKSSPSTENFQYLQQHSNLPRKGH